jgi:nucleotide-binding universal stress UspA family protein
MVAEESDAVMPWVRKLARRHESRIVGASKESLVEAARKHQADLVITSAPRRNALQRLLFGDVTSPIVDRSPAPVLFVPSAAPVFAPLVAAGKGARS